jgi:CRP-like cAMP-binding protein
MSLEKDIEWLRKVPILASLEYEALRLLAFACDHRTLEVGDLLFQKDEPTDGGYLVLTGEITLDAQEDGSPAGYTVGAGALLGEAALFIRTYRPATAVAVKPSSVIKLPMSLVRRVLQEYPSAAVSVRAVIASRLGTLSGELAHVRNALIAIDRHP